MMTSEKQNKRKLIRDAATKIISRRGFFRTSAEEIAEKAGVSVGTIYNYFDDKEEILVDIFDNEFKDRRHFYEELSKQDLSLFSQLRKILDRHFSQISSHKELMSVIIQERFKPGSKMGRKLNERYQEIVEFIEELIEESLEEEQIRTCDPSVVASALFGAVEAVVAYGMLQDEKKQKQIFNRAPGELAEFFWRGIRKE